MQIMQNVARRYGLVCLLHEKPFAGVNGSGKHNNWSMGTDTGHEPARAGRHAAREPRSSCSSARRSSQAVNKHQALLRASVANVGPGPPPRRQRGAAGDHLDLPRRRAARRSSTAIETGEGDAATPGSFLGLGTPVLPPLPMHGGDRNRTSPFAFTGNKFEFRALGLEQSLALPEHGAQHDRRRGDRRARPTSSRSAHGRGQTLDDGRASTIVSETYAANKQIVFDGDNYSEEWHAEAEKRGLANLRTTPDALPWLVEKQTVAVFERYEVLSERELESRYEVFVEQYATKLNIEAETAASIARTMLLPAAVAPPRPSCKAAGVDGARWPRPRRSSTSSSTAILALEKANAEPPGRGGPRAGQVHARHGRSRRWTPSREVADRLERIVADDLWPLPKYSEMLFIK